MAAKSIQEAVSIGTKGLLADEEHLIKVLRDFVAHEVMRYEADFLRKVKGISNLNESALIMAEETVELYVAGAKNLFDRIFKDVRAFKEEKSG